MKKQVIGLVLMGLSQVLTAQWSMQALVFPGFLAPHRTYMQQMAANGMGAELSFLSENPGNRQLDSLSKGFKWGITFYYLRLGKPEINGYIMAINPFIEVPFYRGQHSSIIFKVGSGVGYMSKRFDPVTNPLNRAMSTPLNTSMLFHLLYERRLYENTTLLLGPGLTHYSNGNFSKPNLGINTPQFNLGVNIPLTNAPSKEPKDLFALRNHSFTEVRAGWATKQAAIADPVRFNIWCASVTHGYMWSPIRYLRWGLDWTYDPSLPYQPFYPDTRKGYSKRDVTSLGIRLGKEYYFGRVSLAGDLGVYIVKPDNGIPEPYYFNLYVLYHYGDVHFGPRLKTHLGVADIIEFGIGWRFNQNIIKQHD
jgi:hypothetical protein